MHMNNCYSSDLFDMLKETEKRRFKKNSIFSIKTTCSEARHLLSSISSLRPEFWPCTAKVENL